MYLLRAAYNREETRDRVCLGFRVCYLLGLGFRVTVFCDNNAPLNMIRIHYYLSPCPWKRC
jgi:hypothetical protein